MPRPNRLPFQAALTLLLALGVPLPSQAVSDGGGVGAQASGQTKQTPNPAPNPDSDPRQNAPDPELPRPESLPQANGNEPGPAAVSRLNARLTALEDQLHGLQQQQGFSLLKPPGSLLEILALASLPLSVLALALALIQAQRNRKVHEAFHQRLKELRQELSHQTVAAPVAISPGQPEGLQEPPVAINTEAATRLQAAIDQASSLPPILQQQPQAPPVREAPLPPAPALKPPTINDWIAALNAGQRDNLRGHTATQLNITKDSEDAIQMGRSDATCLEEVAAGGSYLQVSCGQEHWLLPTERTLSSFRSFQPIKGLFTYQTMASGEPQVLQACRLESTGKSWRVVAPGVIRVAG